MTAFSIALGIEEGPCGMKDRIIRGYRGVLIFLVSESVPGFGQVLFGCQQVLVGQPLCPGKKLSLFMGEYAIFFRTLDLSYRIN